MYNGLDNQIQSLQNQIAQISQLYNNGQTSQPTPTVISTKKKSKKRKKPRLINRCSMSKFLL